MSTRFTLRLASLPFLISTAAMAEQHGTFAATKECPLYRSMRRHTNPGRLKTTPHKTYGVFAASPSFDDPNWLRVSVPGSVDLRWVEKTCGKIDLNANSTPPATPTSLCHAANSYDSHVLATSWQAGFCSTKAGRPECQRLRDEPYASTHFTLHGLWPNKNGCGVNYDFCGSVKQESSDFCQFPAIALDPAVESELGRVMPSEKYQSCLERHEWWKHGTCRDASPDKYFRLAIKLLYELNESPFVTEFVLQHLDANVHKSRFIAEFDRAFGAGASEHLLLRCSNSTLIELQINLPRDLHATKNLKELILASPEQDKTDSCPDSFFILKAK